MGRPIVLTSVAMICSLQSVETGCLLRSYNGDTGPRAPSRRALHSNPGDSPMMDVLNIPRPAWMTEDLVLLEEQARRFIDAEFTPHVEKWNEDGIYDRTVWQQAGAAGLLCASVPDEYGGAGGSFAHEAVINREFSLAGFDSFGAPLHSGIVAPYILHYGTDEQKKRWLPKLATGELVGAIAMTEPGTGSDLQGVRTS